MEKRTPKDGRPYYCNSCGLGWGEYIDCEMPDCQIESDEEAADRAKMVPPQTGASNV